MNIDRAKLSPMMKLYMETKEQYSDCILFYRLGDFFELFFDDAKLVSKELSLTLTGRDCGLEERAPMCGVPYHAVDAYLNQLVSKGYKVAICDQVEDPKTAQGIVRREVVRIATPGTNLDVQSLDSSKNQYLMCAYYHKGNYALAFADVTTGSFSVSQVDSPARFIDEFSKFEPSEMIYNPGFEDTGIDLSFLRDQFGTCFFCLDAVTFSLEDASRTLTSHFKVISVAALGLEDAEDRIMAAGVLLDYLIRTQMTSLDHIRNLSLYTPGDYMMIDASTRRNLELCETIRQKEKRGSLFWVLDKTKTAMGARELRYAIEQPLTEASQIERRLDAVEDLCHQGIFRSELREFLSPVYDLERLCSRVSYRSANPRDMLALADSMAMMPDIRNTLRQFSAPLLTALLDEIDDLTDMTVSIRSCIVDDPPVLIRDGGMIRDGYDETVDNNRKAKNEGTQWLADLEERERERTGIKKLRVRYNKVFGYFIEVTNSYKDLVPEDYVRKQTLTNAERYITPELKELEDTILGARDRLNEREYDLFCALRDEIGGQIDRILKTAHAVATLDMLVSLAETADREHYVRPRIAADNSLVIKGGRHPVVEKMMPPGSFVPNDTYLDQENHRLAIITGPNMAGKSTYMRQTALIVLMAQMGSFVPADEASIPIADRIFTRVGASDDLASGQSTFMVEMTEVANILHNATRDSLIILDEIGRGTSTFDGLSIAWAVAEYISDPGKIGAKTLFATHYHEMTELEGKMAGVVNYRVDVREEGEDIIFLRKIVPGGASRSYGIQVARLAGLPGEVLRRSGELLEQLVKADIATDFKTTAISGLTESKSRALNASATEQAWSFALSPVERNILEELKNIDTSTMTPLEALNQLDRYKHELKET